MIDLHTHSLFSDGDLIPSELIRRAKVIGIDAIAITDHVDFSNYMFVIEHIKAVSEQFEKRKHDIEVLTGVEITHVPPSDIPRLIDLSRKAGAQVVVIHGETIVEPVEPGTNLAGINGEADIIAHPGFISTKEAELAAKKGVFLEISGRKGHSFSNGYIAQVARATGAGLVFNSDAHTDGDLMDEKFALKVVKGAGLTEKDFKNMLSNAKKILYRRGYDSKM
ncbi:MAG: histidinol phosphate phosphatase domain-containing protein [bacterium]